MKWKWNTVLAAVMILVGVSFFAGCGSGCKTGPGQYNPTTGVYDTNVIADTLVVTAQNTREVALGVFDGIMTIERNNEAALKVMNPAIHDTAETVRRNGKKWLDELTAAIKDYQADRSSTASWTKLKATLKVVEDILLTATAHLAEASKTSTIKVP